MFNTFFNFGFAKSQIEEVTAPAEEPVTLEQKNSVVVCSASAAG